MPWIVKVNVVFGDVASIVALFFFDAMSAMCWFVPDRRTMDGAFAIIPFIIVAIALGVVMIRDAYRRLAVLRLLRSGVVAYATLRDDAVIGPATAGTPETRRLHFTFEHRGRTYDATTDATGAKAWPLVDDPSEQVVFWPGEEPHVVFVDVLPGRPRVREDNTVDARNHVLGGLAVIVLLSAAAAINVAGAFLWLR